MNFKAIFLLATVVSLSACSHLRESTSTPANESDRPDISTAESGHTNDEIVDTSPLIVGDDSTVAGSTSPNSSKLIQDESVQNISIDLLTRIKNGFSFPDLDSKYIAEYEKWDSSHPTYLNNLFLRAEPFLFHIVEEIEKRGLPMEIALLPAVESAYKPNAVSRSRAAGLWQFVPATGREYGLRQDWWFDGRRDALASTSSALTYLSRLNKMFKGDWFLTLAAYNAGPGTVQRAIKANKRRNKKTDYLNLKLRSETRRYVPKLIALKNILLNPEKYNLTLPTLANKPYFKVIELPGQIDLHEFAQQTQIDHKELLNLNAGFRRWATSPQGPHRVLIPIGNLTNTDKILQTVSKMPNIEYRNHTIKSGDSLSTISRRYGVTISALKTTNNMRNNRIRAGKNLLVPIRGANHLATNTYTAMQAKGETGNKLVHKVRSGDTLWSIARRYKVQLQELISWNNLSKNQVLSLNQSLLVFTN